MRENVSLRRLSEGAVIAALYTVLTVGPVSYTHLDVYKRQFPAFYGLRGIEVAGYLSGQQRHYRGLQGSGRTYGTGDDGVVRQSVVAASEGD